MAQIADHLQEHSRTNNRRTHVRGGIRVGRVIEDPDGFEQRDVEFDGVKAVIARCGRENEAIIAGGGTRTLGAVRERQEEDDGHDDRDYLHLRGR